MIKVYEIQNGTIKAVSIVNYLSQKMGKDLRELGSTSMWHCQDSNYALRFEGEGQHLMVRKIYVSADDNRQTEIKKHLEDLCKEAKLSLE